MLLPPDRVILENSSLINRQSGVRIRSYSNPHFPAFGLNTDRYGVSLRIQSECGKMWTRITPNRTLFTQCSFLFVCFFCFLINTSNRFHEVNTWSSLDHFFPFRSIGSNNLVIWIPLVLLETLSRKLIIFHKIMIRSLRKKCTYLELFWSAFSRIRTEYGEIRNMNDQICGPESLRIRILFTQCILLNRDVFTT